MPWCAETKFAVKALSIAVFSALYFLMIPNLLASC